MLKAVIHRDYAVPAPTQIRVYVDRLLIWNPGELPEGWSMATLLGLHPSQPHNSDVANTFVWSGDIEAWGARHPAHSGRLPGFGHAGAAD